MGIGGWGLLKTPTSCLHVFPYSHCSNCQPSQSACFWRRLFCGYYFRHSCETTSKTGGDITKKNAGWRCRRAVSVEHLSAITAAKQGFFFCIGTFQPRWMITWWETELFFQQNVLLCELTTARLQGSSRPEHNWYISWSKLPDFTTYITQSIKFSFHSSV